MQHQYQILLSGWWGKESALFDERCLLYQLKNTFVTKLLAEGILTSADVDNINDTRNRTPHVRLTDKNSFPNDQKAFDTINNKVMTISINDIKIHKDWIETDLGYSGRVQTHMTLVHKRNIIDHKDKIINILSNIFNEIKPLPIDSNTLNKATTNCGTSMNACCQECLTAIKKIKNCKC